MSRMKIKRLLLALRHFAVAAGWKQFEPLWDLIIRGRRVAGMLPVSARFQPVVVPHYGGPG